MIALATCRILVCVRQPNSPWTPHLHHIILTNFTISVMHIRRPSEAIADFDFSYSVSSDIDVDVFLCTPYVRPIPCRSKSTHETTSIPSHLNLSNFPQTSQRRSHGSGSWSSIFHLVSIRIDTP
jgi:hypothetical protein